jgi:hypothetical protein
MLYPLLKFAHLAGLMLIGAGLIGVFLADIRTRQARSLPVYAEAVRNIALFYDGVVVPGALLLAGSGSWLIVEFYGWAFLKTPWLAGMVGLFLFEFIEGNTVTRLYFRRLQRETEEALRSGNFTPELNRVRGEPMPTFTHFLDLPLLMVIVSLGALRPDDWTHFAVACTAAVTLAGALALVLPRLYARDPLQRAQAS